MDINEIEKYNAEIEQHIEMLREVISSLIPAYTEDSRLMRIRKDNFLDSIEPIIKKIVCLEALKKPIFYLALDCS